jgi:hypothetical protein
VSLNNLISRGDALPLLPDEVVSEIIKTATAESAALGLFRRVNMGTKTRRSPCSRRSHASSAHLKRGRGFDQITADSEPKTVNLVRAGCRVLHDVVQQAGGDHRVLVAMVSGAAASRATSSPASSTRHTSSRRRLRSNPACDMRLGR